MLIQIPIRPRPKQRPRFAGHAYTPSETREYENYIRSIVKMRMACDGIEPFHEWCELELLFQYEMPKRRKLFCNKRPDIDNLLKAVFDALNGVLYRDDAIILKVSAKKAYGEENKIMIGARGE